MATGFVHSSSDQIILTTKASGETNESDGIRYEDNQESEETRIPSIAGPHGVGPSE